MSKNNKSNNSSNRSSDKIDYQDNETRQKRLRESSNGDSSSELMKRPNKMTTGEKGIEHTGGEKDGPVNEERRASSSFSHSPDGITDNNMNNNNTVPSILTNSLVIDII